MKKVLSALLLSFIITLPSTGHSQTSSSGRQAHWLGNSTINFDPHFCVNQLFTFKENSAIGSSSPSLPGGTSTSIMTKTYSDFLKFLENFERSETETKTTVNGVTSTVKERILTYTLNLNPAERMSLTKILGMQEKFNKGYSGATEKCTLTARIVLRDKPVLGGERTSLELLCTWEPLPVPQYSSDGTVLFSGPAIAVREILPRDKFHVLSSCVG